MPIFIPTREDFLRAMKDELIERAGRLYQHWSRPEYKYASLLALSVEISMHVYGFGTVPILWSMGASSIAAHLGIKGTQALLSLYNQIRDIVTHIDETVINTNECIKQLDGAVTDVRAQVTQAQPLIENATVVLANAQTLPLHLQHTLDELKTTVEHVNAAAQTAGTLITSANQIATGFRAVGTLFSRSNVTTTTEMPVPEVTETSRSSSPLASSRLTSL